MRFEKEAHIYVGDLAKKWERILIDSSHKKKYESIQESEWFESRSKKIFSHDSNQAIYDSSKKL